MIKLLFLTLLAVVFAQDSSDIAQGADLTATSTNAQHNAKNIADGDAQSYWASGSDPKDPVDVQLDFSATQRIKGIVITFMGSKY